MFKMCQNPIAPTKTITIAAAIICQSFVLEPRGPSMAQAVARRNSIKIAVFIGWQVL
jgi:hypothetical protein